MKLRAPLTFQQLLFALGSAFLLSMAAQAQDSLIMKTGETRTVKIIDVSATGMVNFSVGNAQLGVPVSSVKEARMPAPPEYSQAMAAYQAKDFAKSLNLTKNLVGKFKGLPVAWAQQAAAMLGELYIETNDLPKAEAAYADFKQLYPTGGSIQTEVGLARIALEKKDFDTAKQKLEPITEAALKEKTASATTAIAYSQAFLVSGRVKEAAGNLSGALEDYLRTVTLFYHDRIAAATAQERADALRAAHPEVAVP